MFDPSDFRELKAKDRFNVGKQKIVRLHASADVTVYAERFGVQAIVAQGSLNAVEVPPQTVIWFEGPKDTLAYVSDPMMVDAPKLVETRKESFTNTDKRPVMSGAMAAVTSASRLLKLEQRQMLAEIRKAQAELKGVASDLSKPVQDDQLEDPETEKSEKASDPDLNSDEQGSSQDETPGKKS